MRPGHDVSEHNAKTRIDAQRAILKCCAPVIVSVASLLLIVAAVSSRRAIIPALPGSSAPDWRGTIAAMCSWDGDWYERITRLGYDFVPGKQCSIVYFPAYPLIAREIRAVTGLSFELSLLITANGLLIAAMILFQYYLGEQDRIEGDRGWRIYALLAFALFPTTFFFRMGYTEAMLVFLIILAMFGMRRGWHPVLVAFIIGLATATRSVGIALLLPFALSLWVSPFGERTRESGHLMPPTRRSTTSYVIAWCLRFALLIPLACWGLLAFMIYQRVAFGNAFAFARAQQEWHVRIPPRGILGSLASWMSGEPLWSTYLPTSPCYWGHEQPITEPFLNLEFANPIYFAATVALTLFGIKKKWLSTQEALLCFGLLCIPYVLQTGRQGMISEGRFAAVAFPVYIVLGHILARAHWVVSVYALVCSTGLLAIYAMLFASGYSFF